MTNQVYANNREVACKSSSGKSICAFPDVCFTPPQTPATPPGVPIPYPNTGMASDTADGSRSVQISGEEVMLKNKSYFKKSTGDEAGCAPKKGMVSSENTGKVYFLAWSMNVEIEGENVVRNLDLTTHNHRNPPNEAVPWPWTAAMAFARGRGPCKEMGTAIKENCTGLGDCSPKCCGARRCLLVPFQPNWCCPAGNPPKKMTPHHLLPSHEFVPAKARGTKDPVTNYESKNAPCICVEGATHSRKKEHGRVGTNYTALRNKWLDDHPGKTYTLTVGIDIAAKSAVGKLNVPEGSKGCDEACLKVQLTRAHRMMRLKLKKDKRLPRRKGHA